MKYWAKMKGRNRKEMVIRHSELESKGPDTLMWVCLLSSSSLFPCDHMPLTPPSEKYRVSFHSQFIVPHPVHTHTHTHTHTHVQHAHTTHNHMDAYAHTCTHATHTHTHTHTQLRDQVTELKSELCYPSNQGPHRRKNYPLEQSFLLSVFLCPCVYVCRVFEDSMLSAKCTS